MECFSCGDVGCHLCMPPEPKKEKPVLIVAGAGPELIGKALAQMSLTIDDVIVITPEQAKEMTNDFKERGLTIVDKEDPFDTTPVFPFHALPRFDEPKVLKESHRSDNYITGKKLPRRNKKRK